MSHQAVPGELRLPRLAWAMTPDLAERARASLKNWNAHGVIVGEMTDDAAGADVHIVRGSRTWVDMTKSPTVLYWNDATDPVFFDHEMGHALLKLGDHILDNDTSPGYINARRVSDDPYFGVMVNFAPYWTEQDDPMIRRYAGQGTEVPNVAHD